MAHVFSSGNELDTVVSLRMLATEADGAHLEAKLLVAVSKVRDEHINNWQHVRTWRVKFQHGLLLSLASLWMH